MKKFGLSVNNSILIKILVFLSLMVGTFFVYGYFKRRQAIKNMALDGLDEAEATIRADAIYIADRFDTLVGTTTMDAIFDLEFWDEKQKATDKIVKYAETSKGYVYDGSLPEYMNDQMSKIHTTDYDLLSYQYQQVTGNDLSSDYNSYLDADYIDQITEAFIRGSVYDPEAIGITWFNGILKILGLGGK